MCYLTQIPGVSSPTVGFLETASLYVTTRALGDLHWKAEHLFSVTLATPGLERRVSEQTKQPVLAQKLAALRGAERDGNSRATTHAHPRL